MMSDRLMCMWLVAMVVVVFVAGVVVGAHLF